jgi:hypothetical protein
MHLVLMRSAHLILRRACPTWGARLEGLRASRRTAASETEPAAILRDGASRLLRMRSVDLSSVRRPIRLVHGIDLLQHVPTAMNRDSQDTPEVRV